MIFKKLCAFALLALGATVVSCSRSEPDLSASPRPASASASPKPAASAKTLPRKQLDAFVDEWLARFPSKGRELGLHQYDGKLADYSKSSIEAQISWLKTASARLTRIDTAGDPDLELDRNLERRAVELALFELVTREQWRKNPLFYAELFSVNDYLDRDYAPLRQRADKLVAHEQAALAQVAHIEANLAGPLPKPLLETAIKVYKGYAEYLRKDVVQLLAAVDDTDFQRRFRETNTQLAAHAERIARHLERVELPRADQSYVLGPARYRRLLELQEGLSTPIEELARQAADNLRENKAAYAVLSKSVQPTRPAADQLFGEAQKLVGSARDFLSQRGLVTLVGEREVRVVETPPYMRWNQAFLNAPGAFETAPTRALYYITLPDKSWSKKEQLEYILPRGVLVATTVHEVYPGHFLQGQWMRRAPTRPQKVFDSYSFVEGWAHYAEQMMIEEGFLDREPEIKLGQLSDALLRNCRFVVSIGIHAQDMSLEEAARRFREDCHQDAATAREQAVRGSFDPGYFAYTLGKLQILKLRAKAKQKLGARFSLRRFHDALLSRGAPPLPWIEERVLSEL